MRKVFGVEDDLTQCFDYSKKIFENLQEISIAHEYMQWHRVWTSFLTSFFKDLLLGWSLCKWWNNKPNILQIALLHSTLLRNQDDTSLSLCLRSFTFLKLKAHNILVPALDTMLEAYPSIFSLAWWWQSGPYIPFLPPLPLYVCTEGHIHLSALPSVS